MKSLQHISLFLWCELLKFRSSLLIFTAYFRHRGGEQLEYQNKLRNWCVCVNK